MSDAIENMLKTIADVLFNKQPTFSTKDIFKHIDKKKYEKNLEEVTQFVLKEMFCENTGSHFLDSGGAYGRGYDRANAVKHLDWMEQVPAIVQVDWYSRDGSYSFYVLKNAYLFLCEHLDYNLEMDQRFHSFCQSEKIHELHYFDKFKIPLLDKEDRHYFETIHKRRVEYITPKDKSYYNCMTLWKDWLKQAEPLVEDFEDFGGYNTYNGDSCLNKTLQWEMFAIHNGKYEGHYIILQIHNGCDVRGGYSTPHIFTFDEDDFWSRMDDLTCRCPNFNWKDNEVSGTQLNIQGKPTKDPVVDMEHVDCYSDDGGSHWYGNSGAEIDGGSKFTTDEEGEHHIVCKKCGADLEFW